MENDELDQAWRDFVHGGRQDPARAPWALPVSLREVVRGLVGRYALGLAAVVDLLRGPR